MDSTKSLSTELGRRLHRPVKDVNALLEGLHQALRTHAAELDSVALPGFGTFAAVKHPEQIVTDRSTGKRMLLPPEVQLTFTPATKLRSNVEKLSNHPES